MSWTIKQLAPATNLETDETQQRAVSCELTLYAQSTTDADEKDVVAACRTSTHAPKKYLGMTLQRFTVTERISAKKWKVTAEYKYVDFEEETEEDTGSDTPKEKVSVEFGVSTATRTVSLGRMHTYGQVPSYGGLIDVQESGDGTLEPRGISVYIPTGTLTITHYFKKSQWTPLLRRKIAYRRCRFNSDTFRGYKAGELLFVGESVNYSAGDTFIEVQYKFLVNENSDEIEVGDYSNIVKRGWDGLWVKYRKDVKTVNDKKYQVVVPEGVAVEKIYKSADFTELGLKKNG
jgi:hypothetical protein